MKKPLSKLERVPLREAWKHEANDFTPWLAEEDNLNTLADALGLADLELVATEHWVGEFKLDILCTSGDDQVIIENQLEKTNPHAPRPDPHLRGGYRGQEGDLGGRVVPARACGGAGVFEPEHHRRAELFCGGGGAVAHWRFTFGA